MLIYYYLYFINGRPLQMIFLYYISKTFFSLNKCHFPFYSLFLILMLVSCSSGDNGAKSGLLNKSIASYATTYDAPSPAWIKKTNSIIDSFYQKTICYREFSGQFLVAKNGHVIYERTNGYANKESKWKLTDTTSIHVASISKVATAIAVLRLVDQKMISLDEKVTHYLPKFPYPGVTVRMLLNHRSGLQYYGYFTVGIWPKDQMLNNTNLLTLMQKNKIPLNYSPGKRFAYCNTNFAFLALIVEAVTKKDFPTAMNELIFQPLKMNNSFILQNKTQFNKHAQSYKPNGVKHSFIYLDGVYGDKNLYTTAKDLLLLDNALYTSFISDSLKKQMFKGYSYEKAGTNNYGLGWRMKEAAGKSTYFFHTAWWHGSTGIFARLEKEHISIIALSNNFSRSVYMISPLVLAFGNYPY
jgi:CubicO group peptidase (beta-lactamase class C family)